MGIFAVIGKWFLGTTIGRWTVGIGAVVVAMLSLFAVGWLKGRKHEAEADQAKDAAEQVKQAKVAQETYQAATDAAEQVRQDAAKQPAPDTKNRTDFDDTF
jgi:hypothetical protein